MCSNTGKVDDADKSKIDLEERQRERRKQFEEEGKEWKPLWFEKQCEEREVESWNYKGGYWEARTSGKWPEAMLNIFDVGDQNESTARL